MKTWWKVLIGLIETWDVLKWKCIKCIQRTHQRLIETWDVLKLVWPSKTTAFRSGINRNMRCIEMDEDFVTVEKDGD